MDYFFPGYAVWAKLIQAAADMGYDTNNLVRSCCLCSHLLTSKSFRPSASPLIAKRLCAHQVNNIEHSLYETVGRNIRLEAVSAQHGEKGPLLHTPQVAH